MLKRSTLCALMLTAICLPVHAQEKNQLGFASPDAAVKALVEAARAQNTRQLLLVLGPSARTMINSGDPTEDAERRKRFVARADRKIALEAKGKEAELVYVGRNRWPLPFPLHNHDGKWFFDSREGRHEVIKRHIGQNELEAMLVCRAVAEAQRQYFQVDYDGDGVLEYAERFWSHPGKKDGLYWATGPGKPESPIGPLVAQADTRHHGPGKHNLPYHGYYFHVLDGQGPHAAGGAHSYKINGHSIAGYGVLAYPAEWGVSGVMTFILNQDGKMFERNLGPHTSALAPTVRLYEPDQNWHEVRD